MNCIEFAFLYHELNHWYFSLTNSCKKIGGEKYTFNSWKSQNLADVGILISLKFDWNIAGLLCVEWTWFRTSLKIYEKMVKDFAKNAFCVITATEFKSKVLVFFLFFMLHFEVMCVLTDSWNISVLLFGRTCCNSGAKELAYLGKMKSCGFENHTQSSFCFSTGFLFWACSVAINLCCHVLHACRFCKPAGSY